MMRAVNASGSLGPGNASSTHSRIFPSLTFESPAAHPLAAGPREPAPRVHPHRMWWPTPDVDRLGRPPALTT